MTNNARENSNMTNNATQENSNMTNNDTIEADGLAIFRVYFDDQRQAQRCANWLERVRREGDFVRDAGTGNRYTVRRVRTSW